jgi:hypothetical protein
MKMNNFEGYHLRVDGASTHFSELTLCDRCRRPVETLVGIEKVYPKSPDRWICIQCIIEMFGYPLSVTGGSG